MKTYETQLSMQQLRKEQQEYLGIKTYNGNKLSLEMPASDDFTLCVGETISSGIYTKVLMTKQKNNNKKRAITFQALRIIISGSTPSL